MTENVCNLLDNLTKHNSRCYGYELSQSEILQILKLFDDVKRLEEFEAIGTIEEFKALKEKEDRFDRNIRMFNSIGLEIRANAIDEAIEASAKAICVGCGYLDGYKCTYNGGNCGVSKPMLESVMKALEQLKGGAE